MNAQSTLDKATIDETENRLIVERFDKELLGNLKWLAEKLDKLGALSSDEKIKATVALRHAIAMDALILGEMEKGCQILIKKKDGKMTEIRVDKDSILDFKESFANH